MALHTGHIASLKHLSCLCLSLVLALALALFLFPGQASAFTLSTAHANSPRAGGPTLQVNVGFSDDTRLDYWTPVQIALSNDGADFEGTLSATTYAGPFPSALILGTVLPWRYQRPIALAHGAQKLVTMYVPFYQSPSIPRGIVAALSDSHGKVIATQMAAPYTLRPGSILVGVLTDQDAVYNSFSAILNAITPPDPIRSFEVDSLDASTLPDMAEVLASFDVIIVDDFTTSSLAPGQLSALQTWVNRGGVLIEVGGSQGRRTLAALPSALLPVTINGTGALPPATHLLPVGSPTLSDAGQKTLSDTLRQSITISTATLAGQGDARLRSFSYLETVLAYGSTPLIVQAQQGQGAICYLAFDPAVDPLASWPDTMPLLKGLLARTLGDQFLIPSSAPRYPDGPGQILISREELLPILQPGTSLPLVELLVLLSGYLVVIGPLRLFVVRRLKRPDWSWRIILSAILLFSLLGYGLASYQRGPGVNSFSITQLDQGASAAHTTSYYSVFIPGQGSFDLHIPARSLAQLVSGTPFENASGAYDSINSGEDIAIAAGQSSTDVNLLNIGAWTLHPIVAEEDQQLQGGISARLALLSDVFVGTLTNTLNTSLSDVYLLLPHGFAYVGSLPAGQTLPVNIPLHSSALNSSATLAEQIARENHLPVPYIPYAMDSQPQNSFQRHLALLSAISAEGFAYAACEGLCSTHGTINAHMLVTPFPNTKVNPVDGNDPLLVAGAPMTLIGWADQPLDGSTHLNINGVAPTGTHDNLIQVPLNIGFSGSLKLPPNFISGRVIDAQGDQVQTTTPGIYTILNGGMTFEFTAPAVTALHINSVTVVEPFLSLPVGAKQVQFRLYNWSTQSWDSITLSNYSFTTTNIKAYTSADGHVLLQVVNPNTTVGEALTLDRPSLSLDAVVV